MKRINLLIIILLINLLNITMNAALVIQPIIGGGGSSGPCVNPLQEGSQDLARAVALAPDGQIVAAGFTIINKVKQILVARYDTTDGNLDCTFGVNGVVTNSAGSSQAANAVMVQPNGQVVVAGEMLVNRKNQCVVLRYNDDGTPDPNFGSAGMVLTPIGDGSAINAIGLQSDNKIVVAGSAVIQGYPNLIVMRYNSDGTPDTNFGTAGIFTQLIGRRSSANALVIQSDGNIVAAGVATVNNIESFLVLRLNSNGLLDPSFGIGGIVTDQIGGVNIARGVALDSNQNIVISGFIDEDFAVLRYTSTGQRDSTFGNNGVVITPLSSDSESNGVVVQADNKIVAVGFNDTIGVIFARYLLNGDLDPSFGISGTGILTIDEVSNAAAKAVALQLNGQIVAAGFSCNDFALYRLNTNGIPDPTFGTNGIVHNPKGATCPNQGASGPIIKEKNKEA